MVYIISLVEHVNKDKKEIEELESIRDYIGSPYYYLNDNINVLRISDDSIIPSMWILNMFQDCLIEALPRKILKNNCP